MYINDNISIGKHTIYSGKLGLWIVNKFAGDNQKIYSKYVPVL